MPYVPCFKSLDFRNTSFGGSFADSVLELKAQLLSSARFLDETNI